MNATTAVIEPLPAPSRGAAPQRRPDADPGARPLRLVPAPDPGARTAGKARPVVFYALVVVLAVGAIFGTQLVLSIALSGGAYQISSLQSEQRDLGRIKDVVKQDISRYASPQHLASDAAALGMVPNTQPAYLRLSDGAVLGAPSSADAAPVPNNVPNALSAGLPVLQADGSQSGGAPQTAAPPAAPATGEQQPSSDPQANGGQQAPAPAGPQPWVGELPAPTTR